MSSTQFIAPSPEEQAFLAALNANLPQGVDWQQGALDYIAARLQEEHGEVARRFHLTKPFYSVYGDQPINQQLYEFTREIAHFANVLSLLKVPTQTRFLDVACGSGWWTHFLSKLSLRVVGIDISPDMIALTQERLRLDPVPTPELPEFDRVTLLQHDMEAAPLPSSLICDVAVLESALHHFVNPIQTLRNIADSLSDDGIIVILELASDGAGDPAHVEVMHRYNTLERPYTRDQLIASLKFAGLTEYQAFHPINGFFPQVADIANAVRDEILHHQNWNIIFAAKRAGVLEKYLAFGQAGQASPLSIASPQLESAPLVRVESPSIHPIASDGLGIKGELQILKSTSQRIWRKAIAKLSGR